MSLAKIDDFFKEHFNVTVISCQALIVDSPFKTIDPATGLTTLKGSPRSSQILLTIEGIVLDRERQLVSYCGSLFAESRVIKVAHDGVRITLSIQFSHKDSPEALELARLLKVVE